MEVPVQEYGEVSSEVRTSSHVGVVAFWYSLFTFVSQKSVVVEEGGAGSCGSFRAADLDSEVLLKEGFIIERLTLTSEFEPFGTESEDFFCKYANLQCIDTLIVVVLHCIRRYVL
jgi:hypothetical protein